MNSSAKEKHNSVCGSHELEKNQSVGKKMPRQTRVAFLELGSSLPGLCYKFFSFDFEL
jgi:hypothetical protein